MLIVLGIIFMVLFLWNKQNGGLASPVQITYSDFLNMVEPKEGIEPIGTIVTDKQANSTDKSQRKKPIKQLVIEKEFIEGWYKPKGDTEPVRFKTVIAPLGKDITEKLLNSSIAFKAKSSEENKFLSTIGNILPWIIVFVIIWIFMMRQLQSTGNKAFSFGKSRAKMNVDSKVKITFEDVAGCEEAKVELTEMIDFLKDPKKFQAIGARIPTGVLLIGSPGTGKTLLAKAVAGEAGVPFYSISGSDFVEMFVGVGASRVRDLFEQGKKNSPCIIFIDEIDAVGRLRGAGLGGGHDEREQTLNQMLVEMDGFEMNEGVIVMAATNRADVLDPALLRPGRFDRQIVVDLPDIKGREAILKVHTKKIPLTSDISLSSIARGTPGFTGADLANLINEAALLAARRNKKRVTQSELEEARDKVLMGPERKSMFISEKEKELTAYHEAGHALLGTLLPYTEPVHKVTIIPRGRALGLTQSLPAEDRLSYNKEYCLDQIVMAMGGYIAEEIIYGSPSNGSSNDIQQATNIARRMVCEWGMSAKLGTVNYNSSNDQVFVGRDMSGANKYYSEEYAGLIDNEVKNIIQTSLNKGRDLVKKHRKKLDDIAQALLSQETVSTDELEEIVGPIKLEPTKKKKASTRSTSKRQLKPLLSS
ncbi:MAG: ATP-dependent zinc metalloprotease FtsH [Spirochaetota bacterium]